MAAYHDGRILLFFWDGNFNQQHAADKTRLELVVPSKTLRAQIHDKSTKETYHELYVNTPGDSV